MYVIKERSLKVEEDLRDGKSMYEKLFQLGGNSSTQEEEVGGFLEF